LLALGEGKSGVFKLRQKELDANDYGQLVLDETRKLNVGLGISVQQLVSGVQSETDASTWQARKEISLATTVMLALGGLTLVGSVLFVWLYVGRSILRRIGGLQRSMQLLSDGDLESEIYRSSQRDEIASMANSLQIFRESMIEARALSADQDRDRIGKTERASRMEARIAEFEATVRTALDSLQKAANSMQATAQGMSATADQSSALVNAGSLRRRGNLGQRADGIGRHRGIVLVDRRNRPPGGSRRRRLPARPSKKRAQPTPPCKALPTTPAASASWSTLFR